MTDRSGIEIDFCPSCRGVWLDRGELDKIIDRSGATKPYDKHPQTAPRPVDDWRGHGYGHHRHQHRKKKSFLSEIFDFD
jgi:hypothetical protein